MSCLYVTEQGAKISVGDGKFIIDCKNGVKRMIPQEIVESIVLFGNVSMTLEAHKLILTKGISTSFLSTHGHYFGRLVPTSSINAERFKKQVYLSDNSEQTLIFARKTLMAKVHNQIVLLRRYARNHEDINLKEELYQMTSSEHRMERAED